MKISSIWHLNVWTSNEGFCVWQPIVFIDRHDILLPLRLYNTFRRIIKTVNEIRLLVIISCVDVTLLQYIWFLFCLFYKLAVIILTIHCKIKPFIFPSTIVCSAFPNKGHYFATNIIWLVLYWTQTVFSVRYEQKTYIQFSWNWLLNG